MEINTIRTIILIVKFSYRLQAKQLSDTLIKELSFLVVSGR
jgi:hypothetical protein